MLLTVLISCSSNSRMFLQVPCYWPPCCALICTHVHILWTLEVVMHNWKMGFPWRPLCNSNPDLSVHMWVYMLPHLLCCSLQWRCSSVPQKLWRVLPLGTPPCLHLMRIWTGCCRHYPFWWLFPREEMKFHEDCVPLTDEHLKEKTEKEYNFQTTLQSLVSLSLIDTEAPLLGTW